MTDHILEAYSTDIDFRIHGFEKANENGYKVDVTEIENEENPGIIYQDEYVSSGGISCQPRHTNLLWL